MAIQSKALRRKLPELFGIDLRALAVARIALGLLIIADILFLRLPHFTVHYTGDGICPAEVRRAWTDGQLLWSIHLLNDSAAYQGFLFLITALAALCLALGWHTRIANATLLFLVLSLQMRNPFVLNGGDTVLRLLLLWCLFLPLGAVWSWDAPRTGGHGKRISRNPLFLSFGSAAILLQVCLIFWFNAINKTDPMWHAQGTAIEFALRLELLTRPWSAFLLQYPGLLKILTHTTFWLECVGPILAFSPIRTGPVRTLIVFAFISFHFALFLCFDLGLFPFISMTGWLVFLPPWFWNKITRAENKESESKEELSVPEKTSIPRWANILAIVLFLFVLSLNLGGTYPDRLGFLATEPAKYLARSIGLHQKWGMFAPRPPIIFGWLVARAELRDGRVVDPIHPDQEFTWEKPDHLSSEHRDARDRNYQWFLISDQDPVRIERYADWLKEQWHRNNPEPIEDLTIYYLIVSLIGEDPVRQQLRIYPIDKIRGGRGYFTKKVPIPQ